MSESGLDIKIDVTLSLRLEHNGPKPLITVVDSSICQQIGRFDVVGFWKARVMAQIAAQPGIIDVREHQDNMLVIDVEAKADAMPNLIGLGERIYNIIRDTPVVPSDAEVKAWAYLRHRWPSRNTIYAPFKDKAAFDEHRFILVEQYAAIESDDGMIWRLSKWGRTL